ncbi:MAG: hypothetical protein UV51_C0017G0013 [Candidatus Woesebacteria bacterium GW2011_GWC1_42_9]|nr:MAG: hypothetical protein UV51_C0017G0013 [Candidatus Woesebacteria bacterium GW2011_GWC1_42_9]
MFQKAKASGGAALFSMALSFSPSYSAEAPDRLGGNVLNAVYDMIYSRVSGFKECIEESSLCRVSMGVRLENSLSFNFMAIPFNEDFILIRGSYDKDSCQYAVFYGPRSEKGFFDDRLMPYQMFSIAKSFPDDEVGEIDKKCKQRLLNGGNPDMKKIREINKRLINDIAYTLMVNGSLPQAIKNAK